MFGGGRRAQPLKRSAARRGQTVAGPSRFTFPVEIPARIRRLVRRLGPFRDSVLPRGAGITAAVLLVFASIAYGAIKGDHLPAVAAGLKDARDALANAAGFRIEQTSIAGRAQLSEADVLALAGVTDRSSLLFFDVDAARTGLKASPWVAEASVRKLYPGRLQIEIVEREPFALWQKDGNVSLIAVDGTVLGPLTDRRFAGLPLVVGPGAAKKARDFLAVPARHEQRDHVRASLLV